MAERYAVSAGNWVAARFDGGTLPGVGDTVHANNFAVTIDTTITVDALSTRAGAVAVAGGSFTTSGTVTVNADSYAGTTNCLVLSAGGTQNGNSYGSLTTNNTSATLVNAATATQNGNATGGNGTNRFGSDVVTGTLNGDVTGGSANAANGARIRNSGTHNGDSHGGSAAGAVGCLVSGKSIHNGDSYGSGFANAVTLSQGAIQNGDSFGGSASGVAGTLCDGGYHNGIATGGSAATAFGTQPTNGGTFFGKAVGGTNATAHGVDAGSGGLAIVNDVTAGTALPIRLSSNGAAILTNGVTSASVSNVAAAGLFELAIDTSPNYPFVGGGGGGGFPLSRVLN